MAVFITVDDLVEYYYCPRKLFYKNIVQPEKLNKVNFNIQDDSELLLHIIQWIFLSHSKQVITKWSQVVQYIELLCIKAVNEDSEDIFKVATERAMELRNRVLPWYKNNFKGFSNEYFTNVILPEYYDKLTIVGNIECLSTNPDTKEIGLVYPLISTIDKHYTYEIKKDIKQRINIYLIFRNLGRFPTYMEQILIYNDSDKPIEVNRSKLNIMKDIDIFIKNTGNLLMELSKQYNNNVFHGVISEQCNKCPYQGICNF